MPGPDLAALKIDPSARVVTRSRRWWALLPIALLLAGAGFWMTRPRAAVVRVAEVTAAATGQGSDVLDASGYVTARRRATVSAKVTGKLTEVLVEEGQAVREGQVLARLDASQPNAALAYAEAQLAAAEDAARLHEAQLTLARQQDLFKAQIADQATLDAAQADVAALTARITYATGQARVAEAQVALRRAELEDMVVRAPFSGVAISKDAQPGETISPVSAGGGFTRTGICTLVDMASLEIEVDVNEGYINRVRDRQPVTAVLDAYPDWRIPAHVLAVVPTADRQKATVKVRIAFDRLDPRLLPDMGVKVSFQDPAAGASAGAARLVVPASAVRRDNARAVVFVVRGETVERRAVTLGTERDGDVEILSGLADSERVVLDAPVSMKDGDTIAIR